MIWRARVSVDVVARLFFDGGLNGSLIRRLSRNEADGTARI